ncbi:MAG: hypothetical protein MI723_02080, partial [Caulobacterales bacterium]|nr:hypothetical protein [Caulobacterales bacterium]
MVEAATDPLAGPYAQLSPALPILLAGFLCAVTPWSFLRKGLMLGAPLAALYLWLNADYGDYGIIAVGDLTLTTFRYDGLSSIFALVFIIATFLNGVYALHERSRLSDAAALVYAGSGVGAVFAGDLITLFVFWELTAASSV